MPQHMQTEWDNTEKTTMRVTYLPGWTWADLQANLPVEKEFLDSVDHRVDVIADFRGTRLPPGAITQLPKIANSPPYVHPNSGLMVMVGSPTFMEEVVNIYRRVYGQKTVKLHMVADLDAARKMIAENRAQMAQPATLEKLAASEPPAEKEPEGPKTVLVEPLKIPEAEKRDTAEIEKTQPLAPLSPAASEEKK